MVRPKRTPNNIKKALATGSQSTTTELNLNDEDSVILKKKSNRKNEQDEDEEIKTKTDKTKNKKGKTIETINDDLLKEPRKRRMASLNAEFLVHYCTNNTNTNANQTPEKHHTSQSPSSSKRRRTLSNESKTKNNRKRKTKKKDNETDENETESEENSKKVTKKVQKKKPIRSRQKLEEIESENSENSENSIDEKEHNRSKRSKKSDENLVMPAGRPKREASMRASAMIIQTNEIEKTRFQYYSSATTTPANLLNSKKQDEVKQEKNHNFQVPQPPKVTKNQKINKKSEAILKHVSTTTTIANSQVVGRNESPDDEESSNDVLIVAEKTPSNTELVLTQELLAEHNKLFGSYSTGNGTFSNHTREYINKWINELIQPDDKPFPEEVIPIDSFGTKILNDPQYLTVKSRQTQSTTSTVKITKPVTSTTTISKTNGKESPQNVKPSSTSPKPQAANNNKNETQKQNDTGTKQEQQSVGMSSIPANRMPAPGQFQFTLPFDQTNNPAQTWSFTSGANVPRPASPPIRPDQLTWTNIQTGSESVNQLIAAAVGCSLATNSMHLLNQPQALPKSMSLPPFPAHLNPNFPNKSPLVMSQNIDATNQPKITYLPNPEYFNPLNQDPSYALSSYAKLKLKSEKLIDIRTHQQAAAAAAAAVAASNGLMHQMPPMINVENVNFYGTLDEQQKAAAACFFQQQDPCLNCLPNTAQNLSNAAAAAAVAMNIAKILANNQSESKSEPISEPKIEIKQEPKFEIKKNQETESVVSVSSSSSDVKEIKPEKEVKQEAMTEEIKKEDEKIQFDDDDNKSVSSSLSSSVHLVVDETSMIVNENLESQMNVECEESPIQADSNSNNNMDSVAVNNPVDTNSNMIESENTEEKQVDKAERQWILNSEPLNENVYSSIKNKTSNLIVNLNDFVLLERKLQLENENVYNELINESSNMNYSCDENECSKTESFAQIKSIKFDPTCDKIMVSVKFFYKPEQLKNDIKNLSEIIQFEENELISSHDVYENQVVEAESIKSKSILSDHTNYIKMKETNVRIENVNEKVYFYRYGYDCSKKEINLIVEN